MTKGGIIRIPPLAYYLFEIDYSAFKVKRLKSRTFSSDQQLPILLLQSS